MKNNLKKNLGDAPQQTTSDRSLTKTDALCLSGVAIIMMIFHHCFRTPSLFENYNVSFAPFSQDFAVELSSYFKICFSILSFLAGYFFYFSASKSKSSLKSSAKWTSDKLLKYMSGFWLIYIISFIITQIYDGYPVDVYCDDGMIRGAVYAVIDFLGLANLFGTPSMNTTWWYIGALIFFILVVPLFIKITDKWGYFILLIMLIMLPRVLPIGASEGDSPYSFVTIMVIGMFFAKFNAFERLSKLKWLKNEKADKAIKFIPILAILVISFILFDRVSKSKLWELHYTIVPLVFIYFFKEYIIRIPIVKQILAFLGKHAMNILLIHTFFRKTFFADFIYSFKSFWIIALVLFAISLAISIVIELFKKLIRFDKIIKMISDKVCLLIDKI